MWKWCALLVAGLPFAGAAPDASACEACRRQVVEATETIDVRATLQWHGNARFPDGSRTRRDYEWEDYYVRVAGQQYRLDFSKVRTDEATLRANVGKTVVLRGKVEQRQDLTIFSRLLRYQVIVVESVRFE